MRRGWASCSLGTGVAGLFGKLPGVEPRPYIIRFTEDRPNPLYRRICYTLAWSEAITFAVLNIAGLVIAIVAGAWRLRQIYDVAYFPLAGRDLGARRARAAAAREGVDQGEGHERRYFYGSVWAVCIAQPILWLMWKVLPRTRSAEAIKLVIFVGILLWVGNLARPRPAAAHAADRARRARRLGLRAVRMVALGLGLALLSSALSASVTNASMSAAGRAPAVRATSRPRANTAMVGIERMPRRRAELIDRVGIDLHDQIAAGIVGGDPRDLGATMWQGPAPRRPEIDDDRDRRMRDERVERRRIGDLERFAGQSRVRLALAASRLRGERPERNPVALTAGWAGNDHPLGIDLAAGVAGARGHVKSPADAAHRSAAVRRIRAAGTLSTPAHCRHSEHPHRSPIFIRSPASLRRL